MQTIIGKQLVSVYYTGYQTPITKLKFESVTGCWEFRLCSSTERRSCILWCDVMLYYDKHE